MNGSEGVRGLDQRLVRAEDARVFAESMVETVHQGLLVLDEQLNVIFANRWFYTLFDVNRAETEGRRVFELGNGQWDIPELRRLLEEIIPADTAFDDYEVTHRFESIGERVMVVSARRIEQAGGRATLTLMSIDDITERRRAERAVRESEVMYRELVESINSIIIKADPKGRITFINRFAEELFGRRREELLGRPLFGGVIPAPADLAPEEVLRRVREEHLPFYIEESQGVRSDGKPLFFSWSLKAVHGIEGELLEFLIDGNDLTPLKNYRNRLEDALHLLDATPDPVALVDRSGRVVFHSQPFADLLGVSGGVLAEHSLTELEPATGAEKLVNLFARTRATGEHLIAEIASGETDLQWLTVPERDTDGAVSAVMLFARDISDLKRSQRDLDAFNYSVSHDLRAPLRAMTGVSAALQEDYGESLDATARGYLHQIDEAARNMGALIDGLLTLSRIGRSEVAAERVDLSALAWSVVEELRSREPDRQVAVDVEPGLIAEADPRLMRAAIDNLLRNAWKFTARTPEPRITFGRVAGAGGEAFVVRDNGVGFPPERAPELFKPFARLHSQKEFAGSGIGLATVQRVIEAHGGHVWAEARPGHGASFYFTLGNGGDSPKRQPPPAGTANLDG